MSYCPASAIRIDSDDPYAAHYPPAVSTSPGALSVAPPPARRWACLTCGVWVLLSEAIDDGRCPRKCHTKLQEVKGV